MNFGFILIITLLALLFSNAFNDYQKAGRVIDLFIVMLSTICILMMLVNYLIICMKG